jgi:hypothetical protein
VPHSSGLRVGFLNWTSNQTRPALSHDVLRWPHSASIIHRNDPFPPPPENANFAPTWEHPANTGSAAGRPKRKSIGNAAQQQRGENLNRNTASIPPSIYMKTNDRIPPNPGKFLFYYPKSETRFLRTFPLPYPSRKRP